MKPKIITPLLQRLQGKYKYLVLYFYPKDNTPGCTIEAKEFSQLKEEFEKLGAYIVGVSKDSEDSHKRFKEKHGLTIELISDPKQQLIKAFDVLKPKKRFGKTYMGVVRSTFVIDVQTGKVIKEFRNVKAQGHAQQVLGFLKSLKKQPKARKTYTWEEIKKHNKETDCWVVVNGKVYDVTQLLDVHPGGKETILPHCGSDATAVFVGKPHSPQAYERLEDYYIGDLDESEP